MHWILRSGTAALTLALAVACGKEEAAQPPAEREAPPAAADDGPAPSDVTRLVMQKKLEGQLDERTKLANALAELEQKKGGLAGGKYAADLDAQIDSLRAQIEDLDSQILLTRATLQQLPE